MKIIAGLGNPGNIYRNTRHNAGFKVIDGLRKRIKEKKIYSNKFFKGWEVEMDRECVLLLKPKTFMNESGIAIKKSLEVFNENPENLIVIHDDLDIPLGKIKITLKRGPGTHKGVISIVNQIGTTHFIRIRIGIGKENIDIPYIDYVLSDFLPEELEIFEKSVEEAIEACFDLIKIGLEKTMTKYN